MKRAISSILVFSILLSFSACGGAASNPGKETQAATAAAESAAETSSETAESQPETAIAEAETAAAGTEAPESEIEDDSWDTLESLGKVKTEDGILTVTITIPADLAGEITQEELDANKGETYKSATLNEDGSVTYKMTKTQHRVMMDSLVSGFDEGLQGLVNDDENYSFTEIKHNKDYTSYDITIDAEEVGFGDTFAAYLFFMYGGMYGLFTGHTPEKIIANYYNTNGNLLETFDSSQMEEEE